MQIEEEIPQLSIIYMLIYYKNTGLDEHESSGSIMRKSVDTLFYLKILFSLGGKIYQKSYSQHYFQIRK